MKSYEVLFSKDPPHKKRKVYHDGTMKIEENLRGGTTFKVVLLNEESKVLFQQGKNDVAQFVADSEMKLGAFHVQIEQEKTQFEQRADSSSDASTSKFSVLTDSNTVLPTSTLLHKGYLPFKSKPLFSVQAASSSTIISPKPNEIITQTPHVPVQIDPQLLRVMHPHQVFAAKFLLNRLDDRSSSPMLTSLIPDNDRSADSDEISLFDHHLNDLLVNESDNVNDDNVDEVDEVAAEFTMTKPGKRKDASSPSPAFKECRGAILADEMGLGKSLVSIAVLWHFIGQGKAKGLIVCPSSLVDNWYKEIKKWLGVRLSVLRVRSGAQACDDIKTFIVGHRTMSPLLIISYELFRKHADKINSVPKLEVIVCDEGHRLKNVSGTKTTRALHSCVATKRIVLTGSPIQNNLDELYAILQFVAPNNDLGSLSNFRSRVGQYNKSYVCSDLSSSVSLQQPLRDPLLTKVLETLVLRRTQNEVLRNILPPRKEVLLNISLTQRQEQQYGIESRNILESVNSNLNRTNDAILPGIQRLRQICNTAVDDVTIPHQDFDQGKTGFEYTPEDPTTIWVNTDNSVLPVPCTRDGCSTTNSGLTLKRLLESSSKLQLLDVMLHTVLEERRQSSTSGRKIVIVSNFTSMLDRVSQLISCRGWGNCFLRLDGSVSCDLRQGLVERFNRPSDTCWVFLLAAKAGGVGLNLIGANRLVMLDCDWNPSVDAQAMARIWRQGQHLPVVIYRFVSSGKIEQSVVECLSPISNNDSIKQSERDDESEGHNIDTTLLNGETGRDSGKLQLLISPLISTALSARRFDDDDDIVLQRIRTLTEQNHLLSTRVVEN